MIIAHLEIVWDLGFYVAKWDFFSGGWSTNTFVSAFDWVSHVLNNVYVTFFSTNKVLLPHVCCSYGFLFFQFYGIGILTPPSLGMFFTYLPCSLNVFYTSAIILVGSMFIAVWRISFIHQVLGNSGNALNCFFHSLDKLELVHALKFPGNTI